jgi:hypothetical protein
LGERVEALSCLGWFVVGLDRVSASRCCKFMRQSFVGIGIPGLPSQGLYRSTIYGVYDTGYVVAVGDAGTQVASHSSNEAVCRLVLGLMG